MLVGISEETCHPGNRTPMRESLVGKSPRASVLECFLLLLLFACLLLTLFSGVRQGVNVHWEIPAALMQYDHLLDLSC